jgi:hypothetical protein
MPCRRIKIQHVDGYHCDAWSKKKQTRRPIIYDTWSNEEVTRDPMATWHVLVENWHVQLQGSDTWNNREQMCGPVKTRNMQEPEMATLCNKKVTHTRTISITTGYSMFTWAIACTRRKHLQWKRQPAWQPLPCMPKQLYDSLFFITDQASMTIFLDSS